MLWKEGKLQARLARLAGAAEVAARSATLLSLPRPPRFPRPAGSDRIGFSVKDVLMSRVRHGDPTAGQEARVSAGSLHPANSQTALPRAGSINPP